MSSSDYSQTVQRLRKKAEENSNRDLQQQAREDKEPDLSETEEQVLDEMLENAKESFGDHRTLTEFAK